MTSKCCVLLAGTPENSQKHSDSFLCGSCTGLLARYMCIKQNVNDPWCVHCAALARMCPRHAAHSSPLLHLVGLEGTTQNTWQGQRLLARHISLIPRSSRCCHADGPIKRVVETGQTRSPSSAALGYFFCHIPVVWHLGLIPGALSPSLHVFIGSLQKLMTCTTKTHSSHESNLGSQKPLPFRGSGMQVCWHVHQ